VQKTAVYICWADDELVYVGMSGQLGRRLASHKVRSGWWGAIDGIDVEWYPSRATAYNRELEIICRYQPWENKVNNPGYQPEE
jgi:predicted GIY-YIG superfamily endonuclease